MDGNPTLDQKLYLVLSVALATVAFFINAIQIAIFVYHELVRNARNILLLNQAIAGLVTTFAVVYPIKLISSHGRQQHLFNDPASCFLLASGFLVLAIFTALANCTLLILEQYLHLAKPRYYLRFQTDLRVPLSLIAISWIESLFLSLLPWLGWNSWDSDQCAFPDVWTKGYMIALGCFYGVHLIAIAFMFSKMYWVVKRQLYPVHHLADELPVTLSVSSLSVYSETSVSFAPSMEFEYVASDAKLRFVAFVLMLLCQLPIALHLLVQSVCRDTGCLLPLSQQQSFVWATLLVVVHSAVGPLLYVFAEEQLTKATVCFIRLCFCPGSSRNIEDRTATDFPLQ